MVEKMNYKVTSLSPFNDIDSENDNVDIEVKFQDGSSYVATFFTLINIQSLLNKYANSGECFNGLYHWCANMIIINEITIKSIELTVSDLIATGEFLKAFYKVPISD